MSARSCTTDMTARVKKLTMDWLCVAGSCASMRGRTRARMSRIKSRLSNPTHRSDTPHPFASLSTSSGTAGRTKGGGSTPRVVAPVSCPNSPSTSTEVPLPLPRTPPAANSLPTCCSARRSSTYTPSALNALPPMVAPAAAPAPVML